MPVDYTTPPSRIVWGHPRKTRKVIDDRTKQQKTDADGKGREQITFGLAIPKSAQAELFAALQAAAAEEFPNGAPQNFAWKFKDGDTGQDARGNPLSAKEGYAGCFIIACTTELIGSVPNYEFDHAANKWVASDKIKCGDVVQVALRFNAHKARNATEKPGMYVNPGAVMLWQVGTEIKGGDFDPNAAGFAPPPPQTPPPGAPVPGAPTPAASAPSAPTPAPAPAIPGAAPNPHTAFLAGPRADA